MRLQAFLSRRDNGTRAASQGVDDGVDGPGNLATALPAKPHSGPCSGNDRAVAYNVGDKIRQFRCLGDPECAMTHVIACTVCGSPASPLVTGVSRHSDLYGVNGCKGVSLWLATANDMARDGRV